MNTTTIVLLAVLACLVIAYVARRRSRLQHEDHD
jgi:hypothetical protein